MKKFLFYFIISLICFYLADSLIQGVKIQGQGWIFVKNLLIAAFLLTILKTIFQPILNLITLPLQVLTLGLFRLFLNMLIVWIADILLPPLIIIGILPLLWVTLLWSALDLFLEPLLKKLG